MGRNTKPQDEDNGFAEWGGYMEAKKWKLLEQFKTSASSSTAISTIFTGVAIFVNGYTNPTAEELKLLMATHGGTYHQYQSRQTTHIIASNLPNVKVKLLGNIPIVKPSWLTDSIEANKLLDYRKYLLYTNQDHKQPLLNFQVVTPKHLTAADPSFLSEFYNNSRLHLISTLGAEFKQLVSRLRDQSNGIFPGREKLKANYRALNVSESVVMHIDMDCFFVSVGIRGRPELKEQPVAVTHARNSQGPVNRPETIVREEQAALQKYFPGVDVEQLDSKASMSEIASCSYAARKCGVRNGMFLGSAVKLCPNLQTIPYDFQGIREVSTTLYKTVANYTLDIEAVSCDEMYVDILPILCDTGITVAQWATHIRNEIMNITGCPCSAGFGANRLQARLATKKAKPAGQFYLRPQDVDEFMTEIPVSDLPGVGYATVNKLDVLGFKTCADIQTASLSILQAELGPKAGETIFQQSHGIDHKPLNFQHERKSVSADVNYGIRFKTKIEALSFIQSLSEEVFSRLQDTGARARCLTLKLLVRAPEAPKETPKFLGCGVCNAINRSTTTGSLISDSTTIYKEAKTLFERANVPPDELRGVGIQLTRLEKTPPVNTALSKFLQTTDNKNKENKESADINKLTNTVQTERLEQNRLQEVPKQPSLNQIQVKSRSGTKNQKVNSLRRNSKTMKTVNTINKYLNIPSSNVRKVPSNIDLNVVNELPEDLRKEIIKEYGLESRISPTIILTDAANCSKNKSKDLETHKSPFDGLSWEQLKPIILHWFKAKPQPADIDVRLIAEYLKQFAIDRRIEELKKMINFLYRHISEMGNCTWHEVYYVIINTIQEGMITQYGSTLLVERQFLCCIHC